MNWAVKYVGLPYLLGGRTEVGLDCWGLVRLVYQNQLGVTLPDFPGIAEENVLSISREVAKQSESMWRQIKHPEDLCAVAMGQGEALHHVGVWASGDGGRIIHAWKDLHVIADTMRTVKLKGFTTIQFYQFAWPT